MRKELNELIAKAKKLVNDKNREEAMSLADQLVEQYPNETESWGLRAYLHALNQSYNDAIADMTRAIEITPTEVFYFYSRGRYRFALQENQLAVDDFTNGLHLCSQYKKEDYREELHFWRAEAFLRLGRQNEALFDLAHVPGDEYTSWTDRLRTKADLVADCQKLSE